MSNVYFEDITGTPFGILVLPDINGGYRWFITHGDIDVSDNEYIIECTKTLPTPYEAIEAALKAAHDHMANWSFVFETKLNEWQIQK
jgi:hypothetical protein